MNASEQKKTLTLLKKKPQLSNFKEKKWMPFKLFELLEQFIIGAFLKRLAHLEKTVSIGKVFIPLEILKLNSTIETRNC